MRSKLESVKPLDANVEKDGAKEIQYDKDSYSYLLDDLEIIGADEKLAEMQAIDDDDRAILSAISQPSDGMAKALAESEMSDEELEALWNKNDLGKYTIGTPIQAKQAVQEQEQFMEPVSELEFQEISDEVDREDAEMQKKLEEMVQELEGVF